MGKALVIAEKPSVGRELARVLGAKRKENGAFSSDKYIVTWALGHLVTLADPEHYGAAYKTWSLETLPMLPKRFDLVVIGQTRKQYNIVEKLLRRKDVDEIIIATDAGREGELVARWIIDKARVKKPMKRLWISSQTDKAIRDGFKNLAPAKKYDNLYRSAVARAEADWLIGLNVTRALTCHYNAQLSAGRVQTPTLAMIVAREEAIAAFRSEPFYEIKGESKGLNWRWQGRGSGRLKDQELAHKIVGKLDHSQAKITKVETKKKKVQPPLLYDLTTLQREANQRFGFSAKETLRYLQNLYEVHKLVSYPRTDSRHLSKDIPATFPSRLKALSTGKYGNLAKTVLNEKTPIFKGVINDAKVSDHHALIPTEMRAGGADLSSNEWKIYDLICKRFLGAFLGPYEVEETVLTAEAAGETLRAKGRRVLALGWKGVDQDSLEEADEEESQKEIPHLHEGEEVALYGVKLVEGRTKPPSRFTEGTLLAAMENPQAFVDSQHHRSILSKAGGIGTPATRADIIEKLYSSFYIEKDGQQLRPTAKGRQLVELVPEALRSPELTAEWEERLEKIAKGQEKAQDFDREMRHFATDLVKAVKTSDKTYRHDNLTRKPCPECGKLLLEVKGKRGKMLVCQDRECGYREHLTTLSNARCPECHKKMEIVGQGEKRLYTCSCGFRERFDRFNEQLKQKRGTSKKEARAYMKKMEKQETMENNAFAEALAKAMQEK